MTELLEKHFIGIKLKDINNYIETINDYLGERLNKGVVWKSGVRTLRDYLNDHDFVQHEGIAINNDTIDEFITRILSENKTNDLNFLPNNKLDNEMTHGEHPVNPLQNLVQDTITVRDLLDIYNRYAPQMLTMDDVKRLSGSDQNLAKAHLINQILLNARNGTLVNTGNFGKPHDRIGMTDLAKIVLDLQRDIKRVKNAISPQGAQELINSHNANSRPSAYWKLNKRNPQGPSTLDNLTDINNDGVPDVVITNANNQPIFVNGYTTTSSNYPMELAYYNKYPTRAERKGKTLDAFTKELYNVTYDLDNEDFHKRGDVVSFQPRNDYLQGYDANKFHLTQPKRMTSFNRFKKFIANPVLEQLLKQLDVPASAKLAITSKACAAAWNALVLTPIYQKYNAKTESEKNKIKKKAAAEIDSYVDNVYYCLNQTNDNWTEEQRTNLNQQLATVLAGTIRASLQNGA